VGGARRDSYVWSIAADQQLDRKAMQQRREKRDGCEYR
jgi:hypothetical protein